MKNNPFGPLLALLLLIAPALRAQNLSFTAPVSGFSSLKVSSGVQVFLTQLDTESLRVEANGFDRDEIVVAVKNGELTLSIRLEGWLGNSRANRNKTRFVKAYLTARQLTSITVAAGAQLTGESTVKAEKIGLHAKSGAELTLAVVATDVDLSSGAGATATVSGTAQTLLADASGGATLEASNLKTSTVQANASSGASIRVSADKELFLKASSGGSIRHGGAGRVVSRKTSLGGSID